jgi:MoaA/NifB/PqqE/SkfB family radical SAM enzyme
MAVETPQREEFDPALLRARPRVVYLELTSRCNARCIYCAVSLPEYVGGDLELDVEQLVMVLRRCAPHEVQLNGHGETTLLPHWTHAARRLLAEGLPLTLTTNLAKHMSDDECDVLGRMRSLKISVDTADAELLEKLRRGVRLARVEENLRRVLELCRERRRDPPFVQISCAASDVAVEGLPELVRWAAAHGARSVDLVNFVRHDAPPDTLPLRHPSVAGPERALARLAQAREAAAQLGLAMSVEQGLVDALETACA